MRESHAICWLYMNIYSLLQATKLHVSVRRCDQAANLCDGPLSQSVCLRLIMCAGVLAFDLRPAEGPAHCLNESAPEVPAIVAGE